MLIIILTNKTWHRTFSCFLNWDASYILKSVFLLQVSRSIGDVYLKKAEFNREPLYAKFRLREPYKMPILSSEPSISVHHLQPHDQFIIFASDGLWEHLSNQEAVDIVQNSPRSVRYIFFYFARLCYVINRKIKVDTFMD